MVRAPGKVSFANDRTPDFRRDRARNQLREAATYALSGLKESLDAIAALLGGAQA